jgi:hypothetical protein
MNIALDVAAANSLDVGQVTAALAKAYLGNTTALSKLGIGISKADLKTGNFNDIMEKLAKTFKGAATQGANTFSGKMARLTVSIENAKETIGKGLIDSFMILTDSAGIEELQVKIENFANSASENFKKLAGFVKENLVLLKATAATLIAMFTVSKIAAGVTAMLKLLKDVRSALNWLRATALAAAIANMFALNPYGAALQVAAMVALIGVTIKAVDELVDAYNNAADARDYALDPKKYDNAATAFDKQFKGQEKLVKIAKVLTAEEIKTLNAKKLQLAIDKARIALGKGEDVFDINKIQLAAAELNQAQLLGKVTSQAQLLQISNDLARLNVKQSILALEDAIAGKDIKAIEAGTAKLNKDLAILGVLTGQEIKLRDIESILKDIVPKDLINLKNLDDALAKLKLLGSGVITPLGAPEPTPKAAGAPLTPAEIESLLILGRTVPIVPDSSGGIGYSGNAGNYAPSGFPMASSGGTTKVEVTVVAPPFTDPNAVAEIVNQYLTDAIDRGTLRGLAVA